MRQAITTKYLGPTNHRGSRVKATAEAGSVTVPWDHSLDTELNHFEAAHALCVKFGWSGVFHGGGAGPGAYVWVHENARPYAVTPEEVQP